MSDEPGRVRSGYRSFASLITTQPKGPAPPADVLGHGREAKNSSLMDWFESRPLTSHNLLYKKQRPCYWLSCGHLPAASLSGAQAANRGPITLPGRDLVRVLGVRALRPR